MTTEPVVPDPSAAGETIVSVSPSRPAKLILIGAGALLAGVVVGFLIAGLLREDETTDEEPDAKEQTGPETIEVFPGVIVDEQSAPLIEPE